MHNNFTHKPFKITVKSGLFISALCTESKLKDHYLDVFI